MFSHRKAIWKTVACQSQKHSKITRLTSTTIVIHSKDDWDSDIFWCAPAALRGISRMVLCTVCSVFYRAHQDSSWTPPTSQASHIHQPTRNTSSHTTKASESCLSLCLLLVLDWQNWLLIYLNWLSVPCRHGQLLHDMAKCSFKPDWLLGEWMCSEGDERVLVGLNKVFTLKIVAAFLTNHQWSSRDQNGWEEAYRDAERAGTVDETWIGTHKHMFISHSCTS